ncbi:MAG: YdbH domain-containing protein [Sphingomonas sp.]|uniref:intermembrane phospholipid transport protein YdbH family protein n=1 Tax=Sphingomonas sp. TaxID=28214 RepID=UPI0017BBA412|nr:YdbH domain-containing protein [Sphingomonas sp.]MBA3667187.1 YdbH domain-containing protein [Sphingomonas sp.]
MSESDHDGRPGKVAEELSEDGLIEPVVVRDHGHWHRVWRITRRGLLIILALALIAFAAVWIFRKPLANDLIRDELAKRGVAASYTLDRVSLRTQQVSNLVIGDPAKPDLVARRAVIQVRIKWNGSFEVYRVAARGVRLRGRVIGNKVSWGQIDKLLPPPSGKPFTLPNLVVDLKDATVALATPYGPLGFAVEGRGNLSGGFKGRLAVVAHALRPGACTLDQFRGMVKLGVTARRPHVVGPIGAKAFACPASNLVLGAPRMDIDSQFSEGFDQFDGKGRMTFASAVAGVNGLANVTSNVTFKGTPTTIIGRINLGAQQARLAQILAQRTRFDGRYRLDARRGGLILVGDYGAAGVALAPGLTAGLTGPLASAKGTPLGPIANAISGAITSAVRRFDVDGSLRLINRRGGGGVRIESARARMASGARINISGGDGVTYYWPGNRIRFNGTVRTQGGGLPTARVTLSQPRSGAPMSGTADFAPYAAGGAKITLSTIRFAARPGGWTEVDAVALLDGPFSSGRVVGLRVPIHGRFGAGGALRFGEGCIDAGFASLTAGALRLGPTRLPLCATQGAIVTRPAGGAVRVGLATQNVRLRGAIGKSPFALNARLARLVGSNAFDASGIAVRMGQADTPVLINAKQVKGSFGGAGVNGTFAGTDAIIGKVPLLLSDASGKWRLNDGNLALDGGLTVSDRAEPSKFYPLKSNDVHFTLADNMIRATGSLRHPDSGTKVSDVTIIHNLRNGTGNALLDVPGIRFGPGLQPEELTRLAAGVIALVRGEVRGQGRVDWNGAGKVTSTGDFTTDGTDLAATFGPVTGVKGTIHFTDLLGLRTAPGQTLTLATVNPGILVENGVIRYQLLPNQLVKVERGEWPFMGGRLILQETILNFGRNAPKRLTFEVVGLNAKTFVDTMGFAEINATGTFDGVLPMIFDDEGGRIVGGRLDSRQGGGTLAYNGVVNRANLGMMGGFAFDALRDLKFKSMIIRLDGYLDGEFASRLTVEGVGLGNTSAQRLIRSINKIPFKFNVSIKGPFRALIATAKSFRDPTTVIEPTLPRPLDKVPGIVFETRRQEESQQQTQTPVEQKITPTPKSKP